MSASPFSYAQAAKGRTQAAAGSPSAAEAQNKDDASSVTTAPDASAKTFSTTSEVSESVKSSQIEADMGNKKPGEMGDTDSLHGPAKDDAATAQDATTTKPDSQPANDTSARPSNRSAEPSDSRKGRKGKKSRSSEKESESEQAAAELEKEKAKKDLANLVEAVPPAVNVWQVRIQAKATQPSLSSIMAAAEQKPKTSLEATTKTPSTAEADEVQRRTIKTGEIPRPTVDSSVRKARGRVPEKSDQSAAPPSTAEDVTSWPTPDTVASEDGKRKTAVELDSKEKQEDGSKSSRQKLNWQKVDIDHALAYSGPVPRGALRTRGGGQAGRGTGRGHSTNMEERAPGTANDAPSSKDAGDEPQSRGRDVARAPMPPSEKNKKVNGDHLRKQSVPSGINRSGAGDQATKSETAKTTTASETMAKKEDFKTHNSKTKRGGGHANNRSVHHSGQQPFMGNGNGAPRGSNHSPPSYGPPYAQPYNAPRGRGRQPGNNNGFKGHANGMGKMHPQHPQHTQHPQQGGSDYTPFPPMFGQGSFPSGSTQQIPPYPALKLDLLRKQAEFYFSEENLYADEYLKSNFDAQGFVSLEVIAAFPRMQKMSEGDMAAIRAAVLAADNIECVVGDDVELVRRSGIWHKFVMDGARAGPANVTPMTQPQFTPPHNTYYQPTAYTQLPMSPQYAPANSHPDMHPGYMTRHQFPGNSTQINSHIATDNPALNVAAPVFSPVHQAPNGFFPQPTWGQQGVSNGVAASTVMNGNMLNTTGSSDLANGTTEAANPVTANGTHVASTSSTIPEPASTNGAAASIPAAPLKTGDASPLAANGSGVQVQ